MRSRCTALIAVAALGALGFVACGDDDSGGSGQPAGDSAQIIKGYSMRLDRRCQVAVLDISLTRDAPLGLRLIGRVPLGSPRASSVPIEPGARRQFASLTPVAVVAQEDTEPASTGVHRTQAWDLSYPSGEYLAPGTHRATLRAFDAKRERVIDTFGPITLKIPKSFFTGSLDSCGR